MSGACERLVAERRQGLGDELPAPSLLLFFVAMPAGAGPGTASAWWHSASECSRPVARSCCRFAVQLVCLRSVAVLTTWVYMSLRCAAGWRSLQGRFVPSWPTLTSSRRWRRRWGASWIAMLLGGWLAASPVHPLLPSEAGPPACIPAYLALLFAIKVQLELPPAQQASANDLLAAPARGLFTVPQRGGHSGLG